MFYIRARKLWSQHPNAQLQTDRWRGRRLVERVHHTVDTALSSSSSVSEEHAYLRRIEDFHIRTRGWKAIGYSYIIMPSGRVYEGRGFGKHGAHTVGHNGDIGVCFQGNYETHNVPEAMLRAERQLRARLLLHGVLVGKRVPHRATFATSCPGRFLMRALNLS